MTHRLALPAAALLLAAAPLRAQPALPDPGARVRVELLGAGRVVGTLVAREPDRWLVRRGPRDTVAVAPAFIERLEVSRGERSPGRAFLRGAGVGALVGVGATAAVAVVTAASGGFACVDCMFSPGVVIVGGGTMLTIGTALLGGIIGSFQLDRWERVPVPADTRLGVIATPHGAGVGVRVALP